MGTTERVRHAGWFLPGNLKPGWDANVDANFNDLGVKLHQLGLRSLVPSVGIYPGLGFFFSQSEYDFIQLLAAPADASTGVPAGTQITRRIVAYSIWLAAQGWGGFSPVAVFERTDPGDGVATPAAPASPALDDELFPVGHYLLTTLSATFYADVPGWLARSAATRSELGLTDFSAFYFTESATYTAVQLVQVPVGDGGSPDDGPLLEYLRWFGQEQLGEMRPVPFMSTTLLSASLIDASRHP